MENIDRDSTCHSVRCLCSQYWNRILHCHCVHSMTKTILTLQFAATEKLLCPLAALPCTAAASHWHGAPTATTAWRTVCCFFFFFFSPLNQSKPNLFLSFPMQSQTRCTFFSSRFYCSTEGFFLRPSLLIVFKDLSTQDILISLVLLTQAFLGLRTCSTILLNG